jgi:hypothetical protein
MNFSHCWDMDNQGDGSHMLTPNLADFATISAKQEKKSTIGSWVPWK